MYVHVYNLCDMCGIYNVDAEDCVRLTRFPLYNSEEKWLLTDTKRTEYPQINFYHLHVVSISCADKISTIFRVKATSNLISILCFIDRFYRRSQLIKLL